jgi:hypothetical protein
MLLHPKNAQYHHVCDADSSLFVDAIINHIIILAH